MAHEDATVAGVVRSAVVVSVGVSGVVEGRAVLHNTTWWRDVVDTESLKKKYKKALDSYSH